MTFLNYCFYFKNVGVNGNRSEVAAAADVFVAPEDERIEALWHLTALRRPEFETIHGAMLGGFWR